jgi:Ca2+-binding RTX toxin-like protein
MSAAQLVQMETTGTTGNDTLYGTTGAELFDGKGGNDVEIGNAGSDTFVFNKGYGDLEINESYNTGDQPVLELGAGITAASLTVRASADQNSLVISDGVSGDQITLDYMLDIADFGVTSVSFANGTSLSAQQLFQMETTGTTGADTLVGTSGADIFDGKGGGDLEIGNGGSDTFVFNQGYGALEVNETYSTGSKPVLKLGAGITEFNITASLDGYGDIIVGDGVAGDQIQLDNMDSASTYGVQSIAFADGTVWTAQQLDQLAHTFTGTTGADTLTGTSGADYFDGKGGADVEIGSGGNDTFYYAQRYGALEITETDSNSKRNNILQLGAGITAANITVGHDSTGNAIVITDGTTGDKITIDTMLSIATGGIQTLDFANGTSLTRAQLIQMETTGTSGADTLYGTSSADLFDGHGGSDLEVGRGGNDTFVFNSGYGHLEINESDSATKRNNILKLGTGISESAVQVTHNAAGTGIVMTDGVTGDQITIDAMISSATGGVQNVQFADGTTWTRAQILQMEETGTTGADTLYGTTGADSFDGKGGTDVEHGNGGADTYALASGYGALTVINGVSSTNTAAGALAIAGENPNEIWLRQVGNNLEVDIMGTKTEATIQGWFSNNYSKLSSVGVAGGSGGSMTVDTQLSQLIQAMATYSSAHTGFDPTSSANPQITDPTVLSAVSSAWHTPT